ncbi:hypothetical protein PHMEG_0006035 [Phytophthora megakarya]|uniref:Uncharacterized protein n=1 Tax=Phytophthora megakarya TaxID=4795 RepID=A0A225WPW6_9STRA|nr:hypothetical protein PHMEG_0006035 [Phytophthora megakarya]
MRMVVVSESILWLESYLAYPVHPGRPHTGKWAVSNVSDVVDVQEVQLMRRILGKRNRRQNRERSITCLRLLDVNSDKTSDSKEEQGKGSFRPSVTQRRVCRSILHSRFHSKSTQYVFERMQQSNNTSILRFPPVCRGLWEFAFLARRLILMHYRSADLWDQVHAQEANDSFTDFSERNTMRATPAATSRSDVSRALRSLRIFAQEFYVNTVIDLIKCRAYLCGSIQGGENLARSEVLLDSEIINRRRRCSTNFPVRTNIFLSCWTFAEHIVTTHRMLREHPTTQHAVVNSHVANHQSLDKYYRHCHVKVTSGYT